MPEASEARRRFVGDSAVYALSQVIRAARGLVLLPAFARMVDIDAYGVYSQIILFTGLMVPFVAFRLPTATTRLLSAETDEATFRRRYWSGEIWAATFALAASALIWWLAEGLSFALIGTREMTGVVRIAGPLLVVSTTLGYLTNYFRISDRIKQHSAIDAAVATVEMVILVAVLVTGNGLEAALWSLVVTRLVAAGVLQAAIRHMLGPVEFSVDALRPLLRYGVPLMPTSLLRWAVNYADRLVIAQLLTVTALGAYSAAYSLGSALNIVIAAASFVLLPLLSRLWDRGERDEVERYYRYGIRYFLVLILPASTLVAVAGPSIIDLLTASAGLVDRSLMIWIAVGFLGNGLYQLAVASFHLVHRTGSISVLLLASTIVNIVLNLTLIPVLGLEGAALATAITFLAMAALAVWHSRRVVGYRIEVSHGARAVASSLIMAVAMWWLDTSSWIGLVGTAGAGLVTYAVAAVLLRVVSRQDFAMLRNLASS